MSLVIRLSKTGKKGERKFRVVVKEKRSKRDGGSIEILGWYTRGADERSEGARLRSDSGDKGEEETKNIDKKRYDYWVSIGAKPSSTVAKLVT